MSYRVRFTMLDGRTGLWTPTYATQEEAQRAIDDRLPDTGLAYVVEEVATPEARIRELEAKLAQLRVGYDVANREVAHLREAYDAARQDLSVARRNVARLDRALAYVVEEVATPEDRIREMEAELAQPRDAYDAARQDLSVAERNVARLESTLAMVQAAWAVSVANAASANTLAAEAHCKTVASEVRLDVALALGDAMHRAMTEAPSYYLPWGWPINRALDDWAAYKDTLAASRQGPAKASDAPGEGGDSGEGEK